MKVLQRFDNSLEGGGTHTRKQMENGEVRERVRFLSGQTVVQTKAKDWSGTGVMPWQSAHYHKGKTEVYTLVSGLAAFVWINDESERYSHVITSPGQTITFPPNVQHNVLLGSGAEISTLIFGETISNPDRNDEDWWPADESHLIALEEEQREVESMIALT